MKYARILRTLAALPWAMWPEKLFAMRDIVLHAAGLAEQTGLPLLADVYAEKRNGSSDAAVARQSGAVAVLPLHGVISNRASMVSDVSTGGGTSVERFGAAFRSAMDNRDIKAIVIDVDSPGGSADGVDELSALIASAKGEKPVVAQINALAASAAYWIASSAEEIVAVPSALVGSIGVYSIHEDVSAAMEMAGVKSTVISAGKYKVEGNPFEPLSDESRASMQTIVDDYYNMFTKRVSMGRNVSVREVKEGMGEGRVLIASKAIDENMIDRIGTMNDTLARFGAATKPAKRRAERAAVLQARARLAAL